MNLTKSQTDIVVADSFEELNYNQKRQFLCAADEKHAEHIKYADMLIKSLGGGVYNKLIAKFTNGDYRSRILGGLEERGIACVTAGGESYPRLLEHIPVPPLVLYCRGNTQLLKGDCFGIVGSRRTSAATIAACKRISGEVSRNMTVVTGIADGADTAAVRGALPSGNVVCVLPGGRDKMPPSAEGMLREVEDRGVTVSEWQPHVSVLRYMFTVRNRVIAGMCRGVLVVSAPKRSGALITAGYAADYGREVFALPHSIGITSGEGSNALIKNGAALCQGAEDILAAFGLESRTGHSDLTAEEQQIISYLRENGSAHIQQIAAAVGMKVFQAVTILSALEIKGLAVRSGGNNYTAV